MWLGLYLIAVVSHVIGYGAYKHFSLDSFFGFVGFGLHRIGFIGIYLITIARLINLVIIG